MLIPRRSLKARAAFILVAIYTTILMAGLLIASKASLSVESQRHHAGPRIALSYVLAEADFEANLVQLPQEGALADFADRNTALWIVADDGRSEFSFGPVPAQVRPLFDHYSGVLDAGRFHVPGVPRPFADSLIERHGDFTIAIGGVDPASLTKADLFRFFLSEGLFAALLVLGLIGLVTTLAALPLLVAAIRPAIKDAENVGPDFPDRRIGEARTPAELLPLVRGFNSALDRLSDELAKRKRFIANVAHELRTPLAIVSLQVDSLKEGKRKQNMRRVVERMSNLVAQMLDVERLSQTSGPPTELELGALVADIVADLAPLAYSSGYEISLDATAQPVRVKGDAHALGRAVSNLIGNAIAHGGDSGDIRVVVRGDATLDVIDSGPGVPAAVRDDLFEPFTRERWDRDGCGLGLHLTREIMRAHGGDVLLLPTERGAAFRLVFSPALILVSDPA